MTTIDLAAVHRQRRDKARAAGDKPGARAAQRVVIHHEAQRAAQTLNEMMAADTAQRLADVAAGRRNRP